MIQPLPQGWGNRLWPQAPDVFVATEIETAVVFLGSNLCVEVYGILS